MTTTTVDARAHWDNIYTTTRIDQTGWFEADPRVSLDLIERCELAPDALIADIGCGNSTLIPALLHSGHRNLAAVDISSVALDALRRRLGPGARDVRFIRDDMAAPDAIFSLGVIDLWHDRAMLHFLTLPADRERYRAAMERAVAPGGYAIIGEFADNGAEQCSGLPVERYDEDALDRLFGPAFERLEALRYVYTQASGDVRPYVYTRYRRC